uniref:COX assembly mitochondrial protein n=1 Tax=Haptolina brevifila TaxID=156173 RepID=A0A7S2JPR7_9EUKA|mmetsp:Transcript_86801/g.173278  ORF Transcript_86801/g.173278 Transcript_86801/m.173278 type:complete len:143 (+) Transcript_86801:127-555(+)
MESKGDARDQRLSGPMPLARRQREAVRKIMNAEALEKCSETRAAYVECAKGRTLSLPFMCRTVFKDFNSCLSQYTTEEELDRRVAETTFTPVRADASIRDGFKGDFFGTAKERGEQYRKEAARKEAAQREAVRAAQQREREQ